MAFELELGPEPEPDPPSPASRAELKCAALPLAAERRTSFGVELADVGHLRLALSAQASARCLRASRMRHANPHRS